MAWIRSRPVTRKGSNGKPKTVTKYDVEWREGGSTRSRTFDRKGDAEAFQTDVERRQQLGPLAASVIDSGQTLAEFVTGEWLPFYAAPNLSEDTMRRYKEVWRAHVKPRLGGYPLRELTPGLVDQVMLDMENAGVGLESRRKSLNLLSGVMKRAVVRGLIPLNPIAAVQKPKPPMVDLANPLAPLTVERIRAQLGRFDQMVLDLLAYVGLRPREAVTADWTQVGDRVFTAYATKTSRARAVKLLDPVVESLLEWRLMCGRPARGLILPRNSPFITAQRRKVERPEWTLWDQQNWSGRVYGRAAATAGVTGDMGAYRLRSSFASLLLWEGRSLTYVADQDGHSVATLAKHYAGVIQELEDEPRVPAAEAIRQARREAFSNPFPAHPAVRAEVTANPAVIRHQVGEGW